jgi:TolA-binding protein
MTRTDRSRYTCRAVVHTLYVVLLGLAVSSVYGQSGSPQEALNLYSDAASFQNNGVFDLAVEEWGKFLQRFPEDPLAAKARYYLGVCNLQLKRYDAAAQAFQQVIEKHPDLDLIEDAYMNLGSSQYSLAGQQGAPLYAQAAKTFGAMLKKFPEGKYKDQGLFFAGEAEYNQGNKQGAAALYDRLLAECPDSKLREDTLYALGVTREELEQYPQAGEAYDQFIDQFPESSLLTEVRMRKAETILQTGDIAAAERIFGQVAATEGFAAADHALERQAYCLARQEKFAEAAKLYARIPTEYPSSQYATEATMSAGRCYFRADQPEQAAKWFQQVIANDQKNAAEAAHWLCRIHLKNSQPAEARQLAAQALKTTEGGDYLINLQMDLADAMYELPDARSQAVEQYRKIATEHPQHELAPQALYNVAFAALESGKFDQGLTDTAAFLQAYPEHRLVPDVRYVAAECHLQRNAYAEAEQIYRTLTETHAGHPDHETWRVRLALSMFLQKQYDQTVAALKDLVADVQQAGNVAEAQFLLGASHFYLEQYAPAVKSLRASLKADAKWKQADEATLLLARSLRSQDETAEANQILEQLIAEFPDSRLLDQAHYRYGEGAYAAGDFAKAIAEYAAVIDGWPESAFAPYALYNQGWAQLKSRSFADAAQAFTALIEGHPQHALIADAHFARGMCRRQTEDYAGAITDIDVFLQSEPEATQKCDAWYERGLAQAAAKDFAAAAASYRQVLETAPDYASADKVLYELAWAYKSSSDAADAPRAVAAFGDLATKYPNSPLAAEANFHVAESVYDQAQYDAAVKAYTMARDRSATDDLREKATYKLAWSYYQLKNYQAALEAFAEQVDKYPQGGLHADGLFMQAECLFRLENYEQALPVYQAVQELTPSSDVIEVLADLHGGQAAAQLKQWDQAIALLSQIPEKHADSSYLAEAHYELGWARQNAGQQDEAIKDYELAATASRGEVGARARFMIGELLFGKKEFDQAIRQFQRVMYGYGGENAPDAVKNWQAKSGFEAARCAEVQIQQASGAARAALIEDARKAYQFVTQKLPQGELATKATERLQALSQL